MKKYDLYKELMKEVRNIEHLIVNFQNQLRRNVHQTQLADYMLIGDEILTDFEGTWNRRFINQEETAIHNLTARDLQLKMKKDEEYLVKSTRINQFKIKPSNRMRMLQNQEKLVAINERIEEAANYRNELKILEKKDELRQIKLHKDQLTNLKQKLDKQEKMELKKLKDKISNEKNKMLIQKNKETNILNKQINLHVNDIKRIQNQLSNFYLNIAEKEDEMKRTKERQRQTNKVLSSLKSISNSNSIPALESKRELALAMLNLNSKPISLNASMDSNQTGSIYTTKKHLIALKFMIKNYPPTNYCINGDVNNRKFCNVSEESDIKGNNNLQRKIRKLLDQRKHQDEIFISPTVYYDDNLNVIQDARNYKELLPKLMTNK